MVNPEHLEVLKKGSKAIEKWHLSHKGERLDLSDANLAETQLSRVDLQNSNLSHADLSYTNLSDADLMNADLSFTELTGTDFTKANLSQSDLSYSNITAPNFSHTNLSRADLRGATLYCPEVKKSQPINLDKAIMQNTNLIMCDLNGFENLSSIKHKGPSHVDIDTLIISYNEAKNFEIDLEPFFLSAGVPKSLLHSLPDIIKGITYCNCFVCYGEPDKSFAERLVRDLKAENIGCWIYSLDATPGKKIGREISQRRREANMMIVMCSVKSLIRDGVKKEIEAQLDEEPDKIIPISLDNDWKEDGFLVNRGQRDLKQDMIGYTYVDFSESSNYKASFRRLLKGLKRS